MKFHPGDEVTVKAKVATDGGGCAVVIENSYDGHTVIVERDAVELVARADDPSKDPVGTVRKDPFDGDVGVKIRHDNWTVVRDNREEPMPFPDDEVVTWDVTGAVPGTPAAEKQAADELARQSQELERPLWVGDGSEEPPEYVKKVIDRCGDALVRDGALFWQGPASSGWSAARQGWLERDAKYYAPWTEVRD